MLKAIFTIADNIIFDQTKDPNVSFQKWGKWRFKMKSYL